MANYGSDCVIDKKDKIDDAVNLENKFAALPSVELLKQQAEWLAPARARALRRIAIAHRKRILDLGAGYGMVTGELVRRSSGSVVALDRAVYALSQNMGQFKGAWRMGGNALNLPFASEIFDLIFSQLTLLWVKPLEMALDELWRVLAPNGVLIALEPDYGGLIEYPADIATRELWQTALSRAGADPHIGRKLPDFLSRLGFDVHVSLLDTLCAPHITRFDFLRDLPLTNEERAALEGIVLNASKHGEDWGQVAHLPFFLVTAKK